ncbi:MAG: sigma-54 dependent transcriptional regulator [bacterium]|nr:sigma-54 dependent transcriptional regulator [bacterium]
MRKKINVLIIDNEPNFSDTLKEALSTFGYRIFQAFSVTKALAIIKEQDIDICFLDIHIADAKGFSVLDRIREHSPKTEIIAMTAYKDKDFKKTVVKTKDHFLPKPFRIEDLSSLLMKMEKTINVTEVYEKMKPVLIEESKITTHSKKVKKTIEIADKYASSDLPVLIIGKTGTGKDTFAKHIHSKSPRKDEIFIMQNCASLPETLIESELFGYEKGAFTGAMNRKYGLFEVANKGTIFLNEIAELPLKSQAKILHIIENKTFRRLGGVSDIKVDTRIIAATNKNLSSLIAEGKFREDLYYRLETLKIEVPDLKERIEDIPLLMESLLKKRNINPEDFHVDSSVKHLFMNYNWPGNIRELENILERAIILTDGKGIYVDNLPINIIRFEEGKIKKSFSLDDIEIEHIKSTLIKVNGNKAKAARILGIDRKTLYRKLDKISVGGK